MICLIDTDVLIDVALNRKQFAAYSSAIIDAAEQKRIEVFVAWHTISNFYYVTSSSINNAKSKQFIIDLLQFVKISPTNTQDALYAAKLKISDFEDAMQIAAAIACKAEKIITRNIKHYKKSPLPALTPKLFYSEYLK